MEQPWVLVVSGASSAGKSSLCRALLPLISAATVLIEADRAFPDLSGRAGASEPAIVTFHRAARTWYDAGTNVILDGSLPYGDPVLRERCLAELPPRTTRLLAVSCTVEELRRRERTRPEDRPAGWAEQQAADVHAGLAPFATVDTTTGPPSEHAAAVHRALLEH